MERKRTILTGYFDKELACDGCIDRGGSEFKNIFQSIYLTTNQAEKDPVRPYSSIETEKNYCYDCSLKELEKEIKAVEESWQQREGKEEKPTETKEPKPLQCAKCGKVESDEKFKQHNGEKYCLDCLSEASKSIKKTYQ